MELINPLKYPTFPSFSLNISFKRTCKLNPSSLNTRHFPFQPPFSTPSRWKIYAQFRQPTKRQNYLRKKLTQQQQVSKNSIFNKPNLSNIIEKKISTDDKSDQVNDVIESETKKKLSDSVLWNEFETWVEQYKRDNELWGIGTGPIFTIHQKSQGEIERVEVNEDEILRRNDSEEVESKISYAKIIAKEMENGIKMLPKNSSVAKFVVSGTKSSLVNVTQGEKSGLVNVTQGEKLGLVNVIQSVTKLPGLYPKMSRLGVTVLVSFIVVSVVMKLFKSEENKEEYTMLEKEMLRRKLKARAEKEKIVKDVSVEIVQESADHVFVERPKLDREELMKNIVKAKGIEDISGNENTTKSDQFNDKIREIRAMAKHAREIESENALSNKNEDINESITSQTDENLMHIEEDTLTTSLRTSSDDIVSDVDQSQTSNSSLRVISSVNEAKEYLSRKHEKTHEPKTENSVVNKILFTVPSEKKVTENTEDKIDRIKKVVKDSVGPTLTNSEKVKDLIDNQTPSFSVNHENNRKTENWMEKNFHEFEPIIKKMGVSFRDNYLSAKEKMDSKAEMMTQLNINSDKSDELDWMKDEKLSNIVFKVRDNELAGKDPFYLINENDKLAFFKGLENKVEQENKKLSNLHEFLHSNIENLDYGADGISSHDPLNKIMPRWKGPPMENIKSTNNVNDTIKSTGQDLIKKSEKSSKTIIQGSDGSVRGGKKNGKEFWEHTKKWSQGFIDSYNAETDPEIKGIMKNMGKDLDRWITEKEIKEAGELMDKLPEKGKKFIKDKLDKVKREIELFGPQAVVSKYREYSDEKEEDYLWWLDLPYVMCIELYTEEKVGLYSLEMAQDLELSPKALHVIGFEDANDCKSLCYIIQHHMEMLGNGHAFVIARPPKDVYREAKGNGFSVTVIRKGEMKFNIDQTLEEVDELISEIGSKIYHDSIMKERNVDINALMKGVFGLKKPAVRRRSKKRKLKKPTKNDVL